jgi:hypothetical protein
VRRDISLSPTRCVVENVVDTWNVVKCPFAANGSGQWECWLYKQILDDGDGGSPGRCAECKDDGDHVVVHKVPV